MCVKKAYSKEEIMKNKIINDRKIICIIKTEIQEAKCIYYFGSPGSS